MADNPTDDNWLKATSIGLQIPVEDLLDPRKAAAIRACTDLAMLQAMSDLVKTIDGLFRALLDRLELIADAINPEAVETREAIRERWHEAAKELARQSAELERRTKPRPGGDGPDDE